MFLGIDNQTGLVYEGLGGADVAAVPSPHVTQAKLIERPADWYRLPSGLHGDAMAWIFREDSFDAVTRTRRGRLYEPQPGAGQPNTQRAAPHPYEQRVAMAVGSDGRIVKTLFTYWACGTLLNRPNKGQGETLALGSPRASSAWRIIQTEVLASGNVLVTLKAMSAFGILPDVDSSKVDAEFKPAVDQALQRVVESAFRETPISVIDHCRDALAVVLSRWLVQSGYNRSILAQDLGKIAGAIHSEPYAKGCSNHLAQVVAKLHSRGKGNEQYSRSLRVPVEEDAELAIQSLGFALREIEWARI